MLKKKLSKKMRHTCQLIEKKRCFFVYKKEKLKQEKLENPLTKIWPDENFIFLKRENRKNAYV